MRHKQGMKPYWISIECNPRPSAFNLGIGVTAYSDEDAAAIVQSTISGVAIIDVRRIDDMRTIEQKHVAPNMEPDWLQRGVWYPRGYRPISK
jgi:hypothetical protein